MAESSISRRIAGGVVAVLMLGGIGAGTYHGLVTAPRERALLEQALFEPYFKALSEGRVDEAWQRYTTPHYQQLFPLQRFHQHWEQTFSRSGHIVQRNLSVADGAYEAASKREYTSVKYQLTFDHDYVQAVYEVVLDARGSPQIDWAGQHQSFSSQTAPEPW